LRIDDKVELRNWYGITNMIRSAFSQQSSSEEAKRIKYQI
jgi:hypothetical protein